MPTVCVTRKWAGVDSVWEQEKLEARKMLENRAESHLSGARFVSCALCIKVTAFALPFAFQLSPF
jgi:LSD1 subclass zinc finger protein